MADDLIRSEKVDLVLLAKALLDDPYWTYHAAHRQYKDPVGNDREVWELWADRPIEIITTAPDIEGLVQLVGP